MLVKIKSDSTKKVTRYKTKRNLYQELKNIKFSGLKILNWTFYDETQSRGKCKKLIVICE